MISLITTTLDGDLIQLKKLFDSLNRQSNIDDALLQKMVSSLLHRKPDDHVIWTKKHITITNVS